MDTIVCPYCGYEFPECESVEYDEGFHDDMECPECDQRFAVDVVITKTYGSCKVARCPLCGDVSHGCDYFFPICSGCYHDMSKEDRKKISDEAIERMKNGS